MSIKVKVRKPSGKVVSFTVISPSNGSFSYSFVADEAGTYYVAAYFHETDKYYSSTSNTLSFSVKLSTTATATAKSV